MVVVFADGLSKRFGDGENPQGRKRFFGWRRDSIGGDDRLNLGNTVQAFDGLTAKEAVRTDHTNTTDATLEQDATEFHHGAAGGDFVVVDDGAVVSLH